MTDDGPAPTHELVVRVPLRFMPVPYDFDVVSDAVTVIMAVTRAAWQSNITGPVELELRELEDVPPRHIPSGHESDPLEEP